jgi:regulator of cell morphogenesis and NO signaling
MKPDMKVLDLLNENNALLLLLEHFEIDFAVNDKTVIQICKEYDLGLNEFLVIGNLYNGFFPTSKDVEGLEDMKTILKFLQNSHRFYIYEKYPELKKYLKTLQENNKSKDIRLLQKFFDEYFEEVIEHLDYEEKYAFPYFNQLLEKNPESQKGRDFSGNEYLDHHTDIETKLKDLKSLMLKHINIKGDFPVRRKFLNSLFDLEWDLKIHSLVEEIILLPLAKKIEKTKSFG